MLHDQLYNSIKLTWKMWHMHITLTCITQEFLDSISCIVDDWNVDGDDTMWIRRFERQSPGLSVFLRGNFFSQFRSNSKAYLVANRDAWRPFLVEYYLTNSEPGTLRLCADTLGLYRHSWLNESPDTYADPENPRRSNLTPSPTTRLSGMSEPHACERVSLLSTLAWVTGGKPPTHSKLSLTK